MEDVVLNTSKGRGNSASNEAENLSSVHAQKDEDMDVGSQEYFDAYSQPQDKGKGRLVEEQQEDNTVPMVDEHDEPRIFRLMDLPTEIRLEIYRACLTRPYKLTFSKVEQTQTRSTEIGSQHVSKDDTATNTAEAGVIEAFQQARAARGSGPLNQRAADMARLRQRLAIARPVARVARPARLARPAPAVSVATIAAAAASSSASACSSSATESHRSTAGSKSTYDTPTKGQDPLIVNILRISKDVYKEARGVLYSENVFDLDIATAVTSLACLHQRSRRQMKHVELEIPTYTEILEKFSEIVRLSLRYCTGLRKFVIHTPFTLPNGDGGMSSSNTTVYANGFDILRWLPQQCQVILKGSSNAEIDAVVNKHRNLAKIQDKAMYTARQLSRLSDVVELKVDGSWGLAVDRKNGKGSGGNGLLGIS